MLKHFSSRVAICALTLLIVSLTARAASPQLTRILPRGGQRGTEVVLTFEGQRLADAQEVFVYEPGVTVTKVEQSADKKVEGKQVKVTVQIAADARLGEYQMRLRTATGISELKTFWVGLFPTVQEKEPNSDFKTPQPIPLNVTVAGVVDNEDQDFFVVEAKKGQRLTAEIEGMRLGEAPFDPYLAILDENRFELTSNDDSALLRQDSVVSILAPKDGKYIIQLRDSAFGGSGASFYRLHVGTFPRPRVVYPLGGQVGQTVAIQYLGDVAGTINQTIKLPDHPVDNFELFCEQDGQMSPSPNHFRVSDFPSVNEIEPNDSPKTATAYSGALPVAFNGIIAKTTGGSAEDEKSQDNDYFKFAAKKGQVLEVNVYARRLRSPLDPVLSIYDSTGKQVATNDDNGGPDSYLRFNVPTDGDYMVRVRDHLRAAGDQYAYRVEITPLKPSLTLSIPQYTQQYSQERQTVTVPRGNRYATLVRVVRQDVPAGALTMTSADLPDGIKLDAENLDAAVDAVPVIFEAAADAKVAGKLVNLEAKPASGDVTSGFKQVVELVTNGNQQPFYTIAVNKMAVAVADEAPFKLSIVEPKVPLVQGGQMNLKIIAERNKEFTGPISVKLLFKPPGIEAAASVDIPANQNEVLYPINASDGAGARKWKLVVVGSGDNNGLTWVSSPFATVEVAAPFLSAKLTNATVEQGQNVTMSADLDVKTKWEGKAKVELVGLPGNSTAAEKEISADDKKVDFAVTTGKSTPATQHKGLFLRVTMMQSGEPIVHNVGRGGLLRVDAPLVAKADGKTKAESKATTKPATTKPAK
ncbi:MAG: peptidase [Phycisphaerales bacterium]|nr:peptidase [Phycisphaerales bacterium]